MTSVTEAEELIAHRLAKLPLERVAIADSVDRVLAESVKSERDLPPFDRVTMDGIAIASREFIEGRRSFPVHAVQAAGVASESCPPGSCIRVMTGAVRPDGTDCVIPVELLTLEAGSAEVSNDAQVASGRYIHARGSDRRAGETVLEPGVRIGPAEVAVLASAGRAEIETSRLARIAIVSTGDELVPVNANGISPWQIRSSNDLAIEASLRRANLAQCSRTLLPDDANTILASVGELHDSNDILVLSGGVSMGDFDFVPAVLERLNAEVVFHRIRQKPGKPMWFGVSDAGKAIFALPGNPVSTLLCMTRYVIPALRRAAGLAEPAAEFAQLGADVDGPADLTYFVPVVLRWTDEGIETAEPRPTNTSGDFSSLADTDGFIELPAGGTIRNKGTIGRIFRW